MQNFMKTGDNGRKPDKGRDKKAKDARTSRSEPRNVRLEDLPRGSRLKRIVLPDDSPLKKKGKCKR